MKKFITLFAAAALGFALIGCSKSEDTATEGAATAGASAPKDNTPKMGEEDGEKTP